MIMNTFFVCLNCGNDKEFRIFTSSFRDIKQSPELGMRIEEGNALPNLRETDTYVECKFCLKSFEYDSAAAIGKKCIKTTQRFRKINHISLKQDAHDLDGK